MVSSRTEIGKSLFGYGFMYQFSLSHRLMEVVNGRTGHELEPALAEIPAAKNVHVVAIDMCDPFRTFAKRFFPNAEIVADKFHVLRLLTPAINRRRKEMAAPQANVGMSFARHGHMAAVTNALHSTLPRRRPHAAASHDVAFLLSAADVPLRG